MIQATVRLAKKAQTTATEMLAMMTFAKHQEHQDEDLGRKRMDDVQRGCKMCGLWMEDERCREVVRNV